MILIKKSETQDIVFFAQGKHKIMILSFLSSENFSS